ncbi:MAG: sodium:solute symporter [Verrucomicrobia bacterium]|nr:sodium:solute symporter [Verrucomicrobiota bacterium]
MSPALILAAIGAYFAILLLIAWITSRKASSQGYYLGNKQSPWYAVAFGLIADSLSGVTFISVPGDVGKTQFSYLQLALGYIAGNFIIATVLLPLYYRMNLVSIYGFLKDRFGPMAQTTGACFFLLSRLLGAAARLYLTVSVLQAFVLDAWGIPFWVGVACIIALILLYTFRGGIKTLVWTDTFQSAFLLIGVGLSIAAVAAQMDLDFPGLWRLLADSPHTQVFFWDWKSKDFFWKQFLSGAFIAVVMSGLDQNSMQKNLSCPNLRDAQKNFYCFGIVIAAVNALFLGLGALLYEYAQRHGIPIPARTDHLFPMLALQHLGPLAALAFVVGLTAATFSSADAVLTTLTTSLYVDILKLDPMDESRRALWRRRLIHGSFALLLLLVILVFRLYSNSSAIQLVLKLATYTYGPLLGLFFFGMCCKLRPKDRLIPAVCLLSPLACWILEQNSGNWLGGYRFGFELLMLNGLLTAVMLLLLPRNPVTSSPPTL